MIHFQAYYALAMSFCFQGCSAITAFREVRKKADELNMTIIQYGMLFVL